MVKIVNLVAGVVFGALSCLNFEAHVAGTVNRSPDTLKRYESQLLRGTAGYLRQYEGQSPREALGYAQETLRITESFQPEKIRALEEEVAKIGVQIGETTSQNVYKPLLKNVSEKIEDASHKKRKDTERLIYGVFFALASLMFLVNPSTWQRNKTQ